MAITIKFRRDTARRWAEANPVLAPGEPGYEMDTRKFKIGDGEARWLDLPYAQEADNAELFASIMAQVHDYVEQTVYDDDGPSLFLLYENRKV